MKIFLVAGSKFRNSRERFFVTSSLKNSNKIANTKQNTFKELSKVDKRGFHLVSHQGCMKLFDQRF